MLGDKWVVLDTAIGSKDHPLISQHGAPLADACTCLASAFGMLWENVLFGASFLSAVHVDL